LLLAVPPYAERERGFPDAARALKGLASRAGLDLVLLSTEEALPSLQGRFDETPPELTVETQSFDEWADLVPTLDDITTEGDVIGLVSEREGSVAWRPSLRRLPGLLNRRFDEATVLTMYMAEHTVRDSTASDVDQLTPDALSPLLRSQDIVRHLDDRDGGPATLESLISATVGPQPSPSDLVTELTRDDSYAPEIRPGTALYHTHTEALSETRLLVGLSPDGCRLPRTSRPVHAAFVLLGGPDVTAETYLHHLSVLTTLIGAPNTANELLSCSTAEAIRNALVRRLHERATPV
jgi:mannitol/fructose-specific phosphotransferase system IIA component (Ntr-type)